MGKIVNYNVLTSGESSSVSSVTTASITIAPNRLLLVFVGSNQGVGVPSVSGAGLTYTNIGTIVAGSSRATVYRAMSASGGTGALTISFSASLDAPVHYIIVEFYNVKTSGTNGADSVPQVNSAGENSTDNTFEVSFPNAFADPNNASVGFAYFNGTATLGATAPYSQVTAVNGSHASNLIFSQAASSPAGFTQNQNGEIVGLAVEIQAMKFGAGILGIL